MDELDELASIVKVSPRSTTAKRAIEKAVAAEPEAGRTPGFAGWVGSLFCCRRCNRFQGIIPRRRLCRRCSAQIRAAIREQQAATMNARVELENTCKQRLMDLLNVDGDSEDAIEAVLVEFAALGVDDTDSIRAQFNRIRMLTWAQQRRFQVIHCPQVGLAAGEVAHFVFENVPLIERRVVEQKVVTEGSAFTLYDQGMALSFGGSESRVVERRADVTQSLGRLILTSHRLLYFGSAAAFEAPWTRMSDTAYTDNEIRFVLADGGIGTPVRLGCDDAQYVAVCCNSLRSRPSGPVAIRPVMVRPRPPH